MKKIINNPNDVVSDMVSGMIQAFPEKLEQIDGTMVIKRKELSSNKVGLVSGGGSGHEPAHAGYVGKGMLDAAVAGEVFTSPTPDQILAAIKAVDTGHGVLLIVKNYTGDVMNFDMASELAESEGIKVEQVIVNDDVAVEDSDFTTGRRGIAGTVFVHKIAGAMAETGATLNEVKEVAEKTITHVRSMGMALTPCTVPAAGKPSFQLEDNEMEIGIGIHGEAGIERKPITSAENIANELTQKVLDDLQLQSGDEVAVMINGLGATPEMELFILQQHVNQLLKDNNLSVFRTYVGEFMTSLEMTGCSVTLLKVDNQLKSLLEAKSEATAFRV
ncbi:MULTISPECIES: dihydroxyacetone kinase subunit DhaK [Oceanobacillus]|uniref:dihydroxyacetone kinase subunit DhaK n=1 Tax=Oceanobacillus TaxID=182709 RepID=UPI00098720D5|nr:MULTISPECIES: dihydroxyacetone kinase subunit DhaK [Oceanobacillus]MBT2600099.1 dihydroxyacetone kinase subunit DhaK [Oceanobacillus sp. ISL-74]MBT2650257.1 dihydroxyacetone kinase subunit DhaK [Oceanobacillus sp. ISL-73]